MASLEEEYRAQLAGPGVGQSVVDVFDTTRGITDDIYNANVARNMGGNAPAWFKKEGVDIPEDPNVPTLDVVLSKLGVKAENDPTGIKAARKFVDEFASNQEKWKKKIVKDPELGERGWETVKDIFKQTANDLMQNDIAEERRKVMEGKTFWEKVASRIGGIMTPRIKSAGVEGREPEWNEIARDLFSNIAYAVPVGRAANILFKSAPAVAKVGMGALSQFAAPTAVAGMDYAVDDNYDAGDLETDAIVGGLTNLGVNRVLGPAIGRSLSTIMGKVSSRVPPRVKAILEGSATPRELADETVARANKKLAQAEEKFASGNLREGVATSIPKGEIASAKGITEVADAAGKTLQVSKDKVLKPSEVIQAVERVTKGTLKKSNESDVIGSVVQQLNHPKTAPTVRNPHISKEFREGAKRYSKIIETNPELKTLFAPRSKFSVSDVLVPVETYAVNQWGSSKNAPAAAAGSAFGVDVNSIKEDNTTRKARGQSRQAALRILSASPELTEEDRFYLGKVSENPDILKFSQDDGLKQWLLKRGHRLLQGTAAHRPLWEVK